MPLIDIGYDHSTYLTGAKLSVFVAALKQANAKSICRYVPYGGVAKGLTPEELAAYLNAGIEVALVWETTANAAAGGGTVGADHGRRAVTGSQSLGYPAGCTVYWAVDFDASAAQLAGPVADYAREFAAAVHAAGYRSGVYGGIRTVAYLFDHALIDDAWQCYAWSAGKWDARATMRQVKNGVMIGGVLADLDERWGQTYFMGGDGVAINDRVLLAPGNTDTNDNKELQTKLNERGANPQLTVDGGYGAKTTQAVKDEQAKAGYTQTGALDVKLWDFMNPPAPCPPCPDCPECPECPEPGPCDPVDYDRIRSIVREEIDATTVAVDLNPGA